MLHPAIEPIEQLHPLAKLDFKNAFKNTTLNHKDLAKIVKNRWIQRFTVTLNDDKLKPHGFTQTQINIEHAFRKKQFPMERILLDHGILGYTIFREINPNSIQQRTTKIGCGTWFASEKTLGCTTFMGNFTSE